MTVPKNTKIVHFVLTAYRHTYKPVVKWTFTRLLLVMLSIVIGIDGVMQ